MLDELADRALSRNARSETRSSQLQDEAHSGCGGWPSQYIKQIQFNRNLIHISHRPLLIRTSLPGTTVGPACSGLRGSPLWNNRVARTRLSTKADIGVLFYIDRILF
jgi:hypothetical protein